MSNAGSASCLCDQFYVHAQSYQGINKSIMCCWMSWKPRVQLFMTIIFNMLLLAASVDAAAADAASAAEHAAAASLQTFTWQVLTQRWYILVPTCKTTQCLTATYSTQHLELISAGMLLLPQLLLLLLGNVMKNLDCWSLVQTDQRPSIRLQAKYIRIRHSLVMCNGLLCSHYWSSLLANFLMYMLSLWITQQCDRNTSLWPIPEPANGWPYPGFTSCTISSTSWSPPPSSAQVWTPWRFFFYLSMVSP